MTPGRSTLVCGNRCNGRHDRRQRLRLHRRRRRWRLRLRRRLDRLRRLPDRHRAVERRFAFTLRAGRRRFLPQPAAATAAARSWRCDEHEPGSDRIDPHRGFGRLRQPNRADENERRRNAGVKRARGGDRHLRRRVGELRLIEQHGGAPPAIGAKRADGGDRLVRREVAGARPRENATCPPPRALPPGRPERRQPGLSRPLSTRPSRKSSVWVPFRDMPA